jgi:ferric-dicitrate binding protein FerR (iron transport regulator)
MMSRSELAAVLKELEDIWRELEIDALMELSEAEASDAPMTVTTRRRFEMTATRNLSRTAGRAAIFADWLASSYGPREIVGKLLSRVINVEAT